jgi:hypothetical protein
MGKLEEREAKRKSVVAGLAGGSKKRGGSGKSKPERECKKRFCLALKPSLYREIQQLAYIQRRSASQIIDELMERYIKENSGVVEKFKKEKKKSAF